MYQENSFVPSAKIQGEVQFSIISDYIGRPVQCYSENGSLVWSTDYDIYGGLRELKGEKSFIPFRQLGQYEDLELEGLYYNRFRYYDCTIGNYISQDPIGLLGNNPTFYGYVHDSNKWFDPFGLAGEDVDWGKYFREISGTEPPSDMIRPHAHHIVFKNGHPNQQGILKESKSILEKHNIDWLKGKENLVWAPNKNHSKEAAQKVLDELREADKKGTRQAIVDALEKMGKMFADGSICS